MTHDLFIESLKEFGIIVKICSGERNAGNPNYYLSLNGIELGKKDYEVFGYYCGGCYAQCNRTDKEVWTHDDLNIAIKKSIEILTAEINYWEKQIDYHDIRKYLFKIIDTSKNKTEIAATVRIKDLLQQNYQYIYKEKNNTPDSKTQNS